MKSETKRKIFGSIILMTTAILWGSSFAIRKMYMDDIGPLMMNFFRFLVAFFFMLLITYTSRRIQNKTHSKNTEETLSVQIKYGLIVGLAFAIGVLLQQIGLSTIDSGKTSFLTSLYTVFVPIITYFIFHEKVKKQIWIGMLLSLMGLYLITGGVSGFQLGYLIVLVSAVFFAMQIILLGRYVKNCDPLVLVTVQIAVCVIVNGLIAVISGESFAFDMLKASILPILYLGIFSIGIANALHFISQTMLPASIAAIICSFESVFGLLFSIILLNEQMSYLQLTGCLMIFLAMIVSQIEKKSAEH